MGKGSEVKIIDKSNDETSLDACKVPPTLEGGGNLAAESSTASENYDSEANKYCATEIEESEDESTNVPYPLCMWFLTWTLCI